MPARLTRKSSATWAKQLDLRPGSKDWLKSFEYAAVDSGRIPDYALRDEEIMAHLPGFFRTGSGQKPSREDLEELVELIREPSIDLERSAQIQSAIHSERAYLAGSEPLGGMACSRICRALPREALSETFQSMQVACLWPTPQVKGIAEHDKRMSVTERICRETSFRIS